MTPAPVCVDFETRAIEGRPNYPPEPVGVAIKHYGRTPRYFAWGHPTGNNCTNEEAVAALREVWDGELLFHNAKFDLAVATEKLDLPMPRWQDVHDTMFLLFLHDPHARVLGLKPSAERLLGMAPEERDAVSDWLISHQPVAGRRITQKSAGAHISLAPGGLVGKYACGDVVRTEALFDLLHPQIVGAGMARAYDRERELLSVLLRIEPQGLAVDLDRLSCDVAAYSLAQGRLDEWIRARLCGGDINLDSAQQLLEALLRVQCVDVERLPLTATGKLSTAQDALRGAITDRTLLAALQYRAQLGTCMSTFLHPWLETATSSGGLIYTTWHQTRGEDGGARTGRLSSAWPNFQNIPKAFRPVWDHDAPGTGLPRSPIELPSLPRVRSYVVPHPGHVFVGRDYSQQELRILAHFGDGALLRAYRGDPQLDVHDMAREMLVARGRTYARKQVKATGFGLIFGMGVALLAEKTGLPYTRAAELKEAYLDLFPELREMYAVMRNRARNGLPLRTWGGRVYHCEPPGVKQGRVQEKDYKMVNVLIQGSAADCTKEAVCRYYRRHSPRHRLVLMVHDEIVLSVPAEAAAEAAENLRAAMESVEFDVPMLSSGYTSATNWADLKEDA